MAVAPSASEPPVRVAGPPPYLWLWAALFVGSLPAWVTSLRAEGALQGNLVRLAGLEAGTEGPALRVLAVVATVLDVGPVVALSAGLLVAVVPHARALAVRRRHGLRPPAPDDPPVVDEIAAFVADLDPRIDVVVNLRRMRQLAFVYPTSWRGRALAVFGGLARTWRADRPAAEAILRHEVAHVGAGDVLLLGGGSVLQPALSALVVAAVVVYALPLAAVLLAAGAGAAAVTGRQVVATAVLGLHALARLVVPLAAVWVAELGADHVARIGQEDDALGRAVRLGASGPGWRRWLVARLSHPPPALRRRLLTTGRVGALATMVALVPAAYVVRLMPLEAAAAMTLTAVLGAPAADAAAAAGGHAATFVDSHLPAWIGLALLPLGWLALRRRHAHRRERPVLASAAIAALALAVVASAIDPPQPEVRAVAGAGITAAAAPGGVEVCWAGATGASHDWVAVAPVDSDLDHYADGLWSYLRGRIDGCTTFPPPPPGRYEARLYGGTSEVRYWLVSRSEPVQVP